MLSFAGAAAFESTRRLVMADERTARTYDRILQLNRVLADALDAQTGVRGFVITGEERFLEPYDRSTADAARDLGELEALYTDDSSRVALVQEIRAVLEAQRTLLASVVAARRNGDVSAAQAVVATGDGKALTDSIRTLIGTIVAGERETLADRHAEEAAATAATRRTTLLAGFVALLLISLAFLALRRENRRRRESADRVSELNRTLESRVEAIRADLEASERRLRHSLDALLEGCAILDRDLRYVYVNRSLARQGRLTVEQMVGRRMADVYPGFETTEVFAAMRRTLDEHAVQNVELEFVFPDGTAGQFELHLQPVPEGLFLLSIERTERVAGERALHASEARHRALLRGLPELVFLLDTDGAVLDLHVPDPEQLLLPESEILGRPLVEALPPLPAELMSAAIRRASANETPESVVYELPFPSGKRQYEAMVVPTDGQRITVVARDITVRQSLEQQLRQAQKMEAVGQLTGGIAHDFNNVLTIIASSAEMITIQEQVSPELQREVDEILKATRRGAEMIAQLLSFSRRGMFKRQPVVVRDSIRQFSGMLERLLPAYVRLELGALDSMDTVLLDTGALEQVLANLCTNARDAMPDGGTVRIDCESTFLDAGYVATHPWVTPGPHVCVSVSDTGVGMDETARRRIFEPFFTTKPSGVGTGLGMAMVYGMMKAHEGMVHVYSEPGQGTLIKLFFPVAESHPNRTADTVGESSTVIAGGSETILLVEDEPAIRLASRRALESKGYRVIDAPDGEVALEKFRAHGPEIAMIISDLIMPNLGGRQLAEALRAQGSRIPILFTSGYSEDSVYRKAELPSGVAFLHKPWTLKELFSRVRTTLDGKLAS